MADLKLLRIEQGEDQKSLIDKSNANFSNLLIFEGGPYGKIGPEGAQGDQGITGPVGSYGDLGQRGNIWVVGDQNPGLTGYYSGDFWLNAQSGLGFPVYQFSGSSWSPYGFNLSSQDLFRSVGPLPISSGNTSYSGYYLSSLNPEKYTLVISDNSLSGATASANPQYSKMVISTLGNTGGRPILEFSKLTSLGNSSLYTRDPRFIWTQTALNYNLSLTLIDSLSFDVSSGNLNFTVNGNTGVGYSHKSNGLTLNLSGNQGFYASSTQGKIILNLSGSGRAFFSNRNITYGGFTYLMPVTFQFKADSTDANPPLRLISNNSAVGGLKHKTSVAQNRNSTLFRVYSSSVTLLNLFANGELLYNKRINSYQASQTPSATTTGSAYTGSGGGGGGAGSTTSVNWVSVVPTVVSPAATSSNRINASNGFDYLVSLSSVSTQRGICLWTPATGGASLNTNLGWLELLNPMESVTLRVRTTDTNYFRFIGLGGGYLTTDAPFDTPNSFQVIDLTNSNSLGVSHAEFTIVNLTSTVSAVKDSFSRWFKVYYSAWGGTLGYVKCGSMYINSSRFFNSGNIYMTNSSLSQTSPTSVTILSSSPCQPGLGRNFVSPTYTSGINLSSSVTFSASPTTVTATLIRYPSGTSTSGTITGTGTSRTVTWSSIDLSTTSYYEVRIGGT